MIGAVAVGDCHRRGRFLSTTELTAGTVTGRWCLRAFLQQQGIATALQRRELFAGAVLLWCGGAVTVPRRCIGNRGDCTRVTVPDWVLRGLFYFGAVVR